MDIAAHHQNCKHRKFLISNHIQNNYRYRGNQLLKKDEKKLKL